MERLKSRPSTSLNGLDDSPVTNRKSGIRNEPISCAPISVEFSHPDVQQDSCRHSWRDWNGRPALYPTARTPSLVRSGMACRLRALGGPHLRGSCQVADAHAHARECCTDDGCA